MGEQKKYHPGMNYIELVNWFWQHDEIHEFSGNETRLYFFYLKVCNSLGWSNPFRYSLGQVHRKCNLSINSVKTAQKKLVEAGLISVTSGTAGNPRDIKNKTQVEILTPSKIDGHSGGQSDSLSGGHSGGQSDTITKPKQTKPKEKKILLTEIDSSTLDSTQAEYYKIALSFHELIKANLQKLNLQTMHVDNADFKSWVDPIRLLVEKDKKSTEDIREAWRAIEVDSFLQQNVQKTGKLREKDKNGQMWIDRILMQSRNGNKKRKNGFEGAETAATVESIIARIEQTQS